jgi:hypothetical protein
LQKDKNATGLVMADGILVFNGGGNSDINIVDFIRSERKKRDLANGRV